MDRRTQTLRGRVQGVVVIGFSLCLSPAAWGQEAHPTTPPPALVEAMNRGVSLMGQYDYAEAVQAFESALKIQPGLLEAKVNLAMARFNRNRKEDQDLEKARVLLDEVLQQRPEDRRALYFKGILLQHIGQTEEAIACFERVLRQVPEDGVAWYLLGLCRQRVGQSGEAEMLRAVQHRPRLFSAYYRLYQLALRDQKEDKAKEYLERFKKLRESPLGEVIELPQYGQMGDLALATPLEMPPAPAISRSRLQFSQDHTLCSWPKDTPAGVPGQSIVPGGIAAGDFNRNGLADLVLVSGRRDAGGRLSLLRQIRAGEFADVTDAALPGPVTNAWNCALGDFDNDDLPDVLVTTPGGPRLLKGKGDGAFAEVTSSAGLARAAGPVHNAFWLDADHDGDLDLFLGRSRGSGSPPPTASACELWNNNGDGTFTNVTHQTRPVGFATGSVAALTGDIDGDRDMDLVLLSEDQPARVFSNELFGQFRPGEVLDPETRGASDGVLQDFNGDGLLDLLILGGQPRELRLFLGDGHGLFTANTAFGQVAKTTASWGPLTGLRVADLDLDGDLDVLCLGAELHMLLNDGRGRFVFQERLWKPEAGKVLAAIEVVDLTGDLVPDLVFLESGSSNRVAIAAGQLTPPSTALAVQLTGIRSRDGRTRSPASGFGVNLILRSGLREQRWFYSGQSGSPYQSILPIVLGLGGSGKADYLGLTWPDGVTQFEVAMTAGQTHKVAELQRKVSSCPVLFAWNGQRFEFVTDFAGVGGLGYFSAPGVTAPPQVLEHVKIESGQLRPRDNRLELRVTEPMEETAYIDRLELRVIDHPASQRVYPDERLAISGSAPTHELLVVSQPQFPIKATDPAGHDCVENLRRVDRHYAYEPSLDRRYIGFCKPHTLELDFDNGLQSFHPSDRVFLFIHGFIEYPYSQTVYAASQSGISWEPIRIDRQEADGRWITMVPDAGVPGGMARMMTVELTGRLTAGTRRLRLTTNLEIYYDQVFAARLAGRDLVTVRDVPLLEATLRRAGFAREYSPDGRLPLIYDYEHSDATAPFHVLKGAYTRYGPVRELLGQFDDRYVRVGPGDEIALAFDASGLPEPGADYERSYILVSHAYCKDMDLYTATPQTVEPLPFAAMSRYPYPNTESFPDTPEQRRDRQTYHTRIVE